MPFDPTPADYATLRRFYEQAIAALYSTSVPDFVEIAEWLEARGQPHEVTLQRAHNAAIPFYDYAQDAAEGQGPEYYNEVIDAAEEFSGPAKRFALQHSISVGGGLSPFGSMAKDTFALIHYAAFVNYMIAQGVIGPDGNDGF